MPIDGFNIQWRTGAAYLTGDRGTGALGVQIVDPGIPEVIVATENFETDPISGSGTWTLTTSSPHSGARCLRSAVIGVNASTLYTFNIPAPATHIRVWHRVSSELNFDFFNIYKDSVSVPNRLFQLSGTANVWNVSTLNVTGATTVIFEYVKDGTSSVGLDAAFIDDIEWIIPGTAPTQNWAPYQLTPDGMRIRVEDAGAAVILDDVLDELILTNAILDNIELDVDQINTDIDVPLSTRASEATLAAFKAENDSNLDAANAELDAQTVLLTHIDGDLHAANTHLGNIEADIDGMAVVLFTVQQLIAVGVAGTATNGVQISTAGAAAVSILAANGSRKGAIVKNIGVASCRIGVSGVTATTGIAQLAPGDTLTLNMPFCPDEQLFMIREGAVNSTVLVSEQT